MGQPVVHFEVVGPDGEKLRNYYKEMFGWEADANNPMNYGLVSEGGQHDLRGRRIGGGLGQGPEGYGGHVTFYVEVPDVEASLAQAESLGGSRVMGPETIMEDVTLGLVQRPRRQPDRSCSRAPASASRPPPGAPLRRRGPTRSAARSRRA